MTEFIKISHDNVFAQLNYFQVFPDSPNGKLVTYTAYPDGPYPEQKGPAEVWICSASGKGHRKIGDISCAEQHRGAHPTWITDDKLAFGNNSDVHIAQIESEGIQVFKGCIDNYSALKKYCSTIQKAEIRRMRAMNPGFTVLMLITEIWNCWSPWLSWLASGLWKALTMRPEIGGWLILTGHPELLK